MIPVRGWTVLLAGALLATAVAFGGRGFVGIAQDAATPNDVVIVQCVDGTPVGTPVTAGTPLVVDASPDSAADEMAGGTPAGMMGHDMGSPAASPVASPTGFICIQE